MKKILISCTICLSALFATAQNRAIDSLNNLLRTTKEDTTKVQVLARLSFYEPGFQRGLDLANEGLVLARKIKYETGEAICLNQIGNQYGNIANYPQALYYYLESLKLKEKIGYQSGLTASYMNIGAVYREQGDYDKALNYFYKAQNITYTDKYKLAIAQGDFGDVYYVMGKLDSSLKYYQLSYENFLIANDKFQFNITLNGLGNLQAKMGNKELALGYYRQAESNGIANSDTFGLSHTYLLMATLFDSSRQEDSAIYYGNKALLFAQNGIVLDNVVNAGKLLSLLYQNKDDKAALHYLQVSQAAADSLFSKSRSIQIQNLSFNENVREAELQQKEQEEQEQRKLNIQFALLALCIVSFVIVFLLLSRSFITNSRVITFLSVVALLLVFEFLNLLLHPFLETITHHSPPLMLLSLVCIAALLVPLHHKLQHWATMKLVEKNKQIRLAAAKKTIEELEKPNTGKDN